MTIMKRSRAMGWAPILVPRPCFEWFFMSAIARISSLAKITQLGEISPNYGFWSTKEKTLLFPCNVTKQNFILIMIMCKGKLQTYLGMCGYVTICVRKYVFRLDTVCCLVGDFIFALVGTSHFYPKLVSLLKNIP